jgi:hypothetical protein
MAEHRRTQRVQGRYWCVFSDIDAINSAGRVDRTRKRILIISTTTANAIAL